MTEHPLHELMDMVLCHARVDGNVHAACRLYRERFPGCRQPTRKTLRRAVARFLETGNIVHRPRQGRPRTVAIEEPAVMVLAAVAANPHTSEPLKRMLVSVVHLCTEYCMNISFIHSTCIATRL
uniref:DUF4817 domain-containing protein n=1 Tax=Strigamia maritima TaxID=126957 RepID=T1IS21_STRMM